MSRSFLLALIPVAAIAGRLLAHIVDRVCPEGYECPTCGFMRGDSLDREIHMWLAHGRLAGQLPAASQLLGMRADEETLDVTTFGNQDEAAT